MSRKTSALLFIVILIGVSTGVWMAVDKRQQPKCPICDRVIHPESRAVIEVGGKKKTVCCIRCALSAHMQENEPVRIVQVSDYSTGTLIDPRNAYFVGNTPLVVCEQHSMPPDEAKRPYMRIFDRCEPSVMAFSRLEDAQQFIADHGGTLQRWAEVVKQTGAAQ